MAKKVTNKTNKGGKGAAASAAPAAQPARNYLAEAVVALNSNTPLMVTHSEMASLLNDPRGALVEFNENVKDGDKVAYRATALGVQVASAPPPAAAPGWGQPATAQPGAWGAPAGQPAPAAPPSNPSPSPSPRPSNIKFDSGIPIPAARRGGRGSAVYGFETMNVGESFFIAATADNPNPAKRIASTVSSATKRLEPKKFLVRSVDETANGGGKGARVWRSE